MIHVVQGSEVATQQSAENQNARSEAELMDMFDNESGASWDQYRKIKYAILRGKPEELRSHRIAELLNQLDDLQLEASSNGLYSLEDRVAEVGISYS